MVLRQAVERSQGSGSSVVGALLAEKMSQYSSLLASQGSLDTALAYLPDNTNQVNKPTDPAAHHGVDTMSAQVAPGVT